MNQILAALIASYLVAHCLGHGKEPLKPHLSPATLAALYPTPNPNAEPATGQTVHTCFNGYTLFNDGTCVKDIDIPATPACPTGTLVGDGCEIQVPYIFQCPGGYEQVSDGFCKKTSEVPPQFYCPVGFYDDGNSCAQTTPGEIATQCDIGELIGDTCVSVQRAEHIINAVCPQGSELEQDGNCWKIVDTFDCTESPAQESHVVVAPKQHVSIGKKVFVSKGKGAKLRHLSGNKRVLPQPVNIVIPVTEPAPEPEECLKEMIAVSAPRPTKIGVASQVCHKKVQVDAQAITSCPPSFFDNGTFCILERVTPATTICLSGNARNGTCSPVTKRAPKHPGCPKDSFTDHGKCYATESIPGNSVCPKGFSDNETGCIGLVETPGWECPVGLTLVNDRCIGQKVRPPISLTVEPEASCTETKY